MREKGIDKYAKAQTTICTQYTDNNEYRNNNVVSKEEEENSRGLKLYRSTEQLLVFKRTEV